MTDLTRPAETAIEPQVISRANPEPQDLLQARAAIQASPYLQEMFRLFHEEAWEPGYLADILAVELQKDWPEGKSPFEATSFLEDEFRQIGPAGIQIISTVTGKIAAIIQEKDIYQPAPVPREGGGVTGELVQPLPRINPGLESAIVLWFHSKGREQATLQALAERGHQTALLRDLGDPRLLVATKAGRKEIVGHFAQEVPKTLLEAAGGTGGAFLRKFRFDEPPDGLWGAKCTVSSKSLMGIQDQKTVNLHHNRPATLRGALVQGWIREIGRLLSMAAHDHLGVQDTLDVRSVHKLPGDFWVAEPDIIRPFHQIDPKVQVLPVPGARTILVGDDVGYIRLPEQFRAHNLEIFDRWQVTTALEIEMWVDWSRVRTVNVVGVELQAQLL